MAHRQQEEIVVVRCIMLSHVLTMQSFPSMKCAIVIVFERLFGRFERKKL